MAGAGSRLALGTVQFGLTYGVANVHGQIDRATATAILDRGRSAGMDTLDTAIAYGSSEERLGEIGVDGWKVISKLPPADEPCPEPSKWVIEMVRGSLRRLNVERLDGLLLHRPSQLLGPFGAQLYDGLRAARAEGLVRKIGVSIYEPSELDDLCARFSFDIVQAPFNVLDRRLATSGWMERLRASNVEIHVRSVFLQGLLLMPNGKRPEYFHRWDSVWREWDGWLKASSVSPVEACLGFVAGHEDIDRIVVGVDSLAHLDQLIAASSARPRDVPGSISSAEPDLLNPGRWQVQ
jgi:aryl-alcohol dehydrogenase-like predicted oxidoreductase